ncbi:MAG: hypothetical protein RSB50_06315 [Cetobacterium sp.]
MSTEQKYKEFLEGLKNDMMYQTLPNLKWNQETVDLITELKEKFMDLSLKSNYYFESGYDMDTHAKKSEILGKIVMLTHYFRGFKDVEKVVHDLRWDMIDIMEAILLPDEECDK